MPPAKPDEIITAMPTHDALAQAHILALQTMSDRIGVLTRTVEGLATDAKDTRESVIRLEAQDLKATMFEQRREALGAIDKLEGEHDQRIGKVETQGQANAHAISRIQGVFLPLGVIGAGVLAFLGELFANLAMGRHP